MQIWSKGPVAITGAGGHVGGFLERRLEDLPNEVRALNRDDFWKQGSGDASAVIHLAGTLAAVGGNGYDEANVATVRRTLAAIEGSFSARPTSASVTCPRAGARARSCRAEPDLGHGRGARGRLAVADVYGPAPVRARTG